MQLEPKQAKVIFTPDIFTGLGWIEVIYRGRELSQARLNVLLFSPGSRTAWHSIRPGQTLYVTEGSGLVVARGELVIPVRTGDTVRISPGEEYWQGAMPDSFVSMLALREGDEVAVGEHIPEDEYAAAVSVARRLSVG
ncbi:cupin domain-containing protein [Nocardia brasiliensis]